MFVSQTHSGGTTDSPTFAKDWSSSEFQKTSKYERYPCIPRPGQILQKIHQRIQQHRSSAYRPNEEDEPKQLKWTEKCENAFQSPKDSLRSDSVLVSPGYSKVFELQTDVSDQGFGVVLSQ